MDERIKVKYLRYIGILFWTLFRKVFGLVWYYMAIPFRRYARNVVYNYVLQNGIYLKRLLDRPILGIPNKPQNLYIDNKYVFGYKINPYHKTDGGYIKFRNISRIEYEFVYWFIWGWLDDDSMHDTMAVKYNVSIIHGERSAVSR